MPKCGRCNQDLTNKDVTAKCVQCEVSFHPQCVRFGSTENFKRKDIKTWKCDSCREDSSSVRSEDSTEERKIIDVLHAMKFEINTNVRGVKESVDQLSVDVKALSSKIDALEVGQTAMTERCNQLEDQNRQLSDEVCKLQLQLQDTEQHARSANIEVVGLPVTEGECIYACLQRVAGAIQVPFKREDISLAHRLKVYSRTLHTHPPIIVQFVSRSVRGEWLIAARKRRGLTAKDVDAAFPSTPVYINEQLTRANKMLLGAARALVREKKLHSARFLNGKVLVRTAENSEAVRVRTVSDLAKFDQ